jgi:hypothetical protein
VIFGSGDDSRAASVAAHLEPFWKIWSAARIAEGDWEEQVLKAISSSSAVIAIVSPNSRGKKVFADELRYSKQQDKMIFPFVVEQADLPLGFGGLNRTEAIGWNGSSDHPGLGQLVEKISRALDTQSHQRDPK